MFDVPFDVAATITGFRHDRGEGWERFTDLQALEPINGNVLTKLGHPPILTQMVADAAFERVSLSPRLATDGSATVVGAAPVPAVLTI